MRYSSFIAALSITLMAAVGCLDPSSDVDTQSSALAPATADWRQELEPDVITHASEEELWVEISSPIAGSRLDPGFSVYVASGPAGSIDSIELLVDGALYATDTGFPYILVTDDSLAGGARVLTARVNAGGETLTHEVAIEVSGDDPDPDPSPDPDPNPDPDPSPDPNPTPDPDPEPDPRPDNVSDLGGPACATTRSTKPGLAPLLWLLVIGLVVRRRRRS